MKIIIWASSGPKIGGGHISRCQVLKAALQLHGYDVAFNPETPFTTLTNLVKAKSYDVLIIDDYAIDAVFEKQCRQWVKHIFCIDDLANRLHDCDLLLDPTPGRMPIEYQSRVPLHCKLLLGSQYALVAASFNQHRLQSLRHRQTVALIKKVVISFGATDPDDWSSLCLKALIPLLDELKISVTLTDMAPHLNRVRQLCESIGVVLHENPYDMAYLMANADLAIGACGGSSWERCCLGLPSIVGVVAPNQEYVAKALSDNQAALVLRGNKARFFSEVTRAINVLRLNRNLYKNLSTNAAKLCDGNGAQRVAKIVVEYFNNHSTH